MIGRLARTGKRALPAPVADRLRRARALARLARDSRALEQLRWLAKGVAFAGDWPPATDRGPHERADNPLRAFFDARREGQGIWKWDHYFDIYHRHLERFRGGEVHVVEIGIYSGGSLELWGDYFGPGCRIYGVDLEESCKRYETESVRVFIGDQADRDFWRRFRAEVPIVDIVVDDGGHAPAQQAVTLEELLPHIQPGGVYVCEDVHGSRNAFGGYVGGLVQALNTAKLTKSFTDPERRLVGNASGFQAVVDSIHCYPFATVIEKRRAPVKELVAPKHGTEWEPFLR